MALSTNEVPYYDLTNSPTGCCPVFQPEPWEGATLRFEDKLFLRVTTRSILHVPLNMGKVFARAQEALVAHDAADGFLVLSRDVSAFTGEHLFAAAQEVPGFEMVRLSGTFATKVFEGPYSQAGAWHKEMAALAGGRGEDVYFFYTTCPRCAKVYGKNYVVGLAKVS